jgi:hypothetical protein
MRRSNCHLEAWRRYRSGEAVGFCFLPTKWSRAARVVMLPICLPVRLVGMALQWLCWPLTHLGEFLRSGHWYHVIWIDRTGRRWEFVPDAAKRMRFAPPLVFRGRVQEVSSGRTGNRGCHPDHP